MRDYLEEALGMLKEKEANMWNRLHPDAQTKEEGEDDTPQQREQAIFFDPGHQHGGPI